MCLAASRVQSLELAYACGGQVLACYARSRSSEGWDWNSSSLAFTGVRLDCHAAAHRPGKRTWKGMYRFLQRGTSASSAGDRSPPQCVMEVSHSTCSGRPCCCFPRCCRLRRCRWACRTSLLASSKCARKLLCSRVPAVVKASHTSCPVPGDCSPGFTTRLHRSQPRVATCLHHSRPVKQPAPETAAQSRRRSQAGRAGT